MLEMSGTTWWGVPRRVREKVWEMHGNMNVSPFPVIYNYVTTAGTICLHLNKTQGYVNCVAGGVMDTVLVTGQSMDVSLSGNNLGHWANCSYVPQWSRRVNGMLLMLSTGSSRQRPGGAGNQ